jgi:hypothetical protein
MRNRTLMAPSRKWADERRTAARNSHYLVLSAQSNPVKHMLARSLCLSSLVYVPLFAARAYAASGRQAHWTSSNDIHYIIMIYFRIVWRLSRK